MDATFLVWLLTSKLWNLGGVGGELCHLGLVISQQQPSEPANVYAMARECSSVYYSFSLCEVASNLRVECHCKYESLWQDSMWKKRAGSMNVWMQACKHVQFTPYLLLILVLSLSVWLSL